jgi:hypothetical protein
VPSQVHNWRGEMARVRLLQEAEERLQQECTFSPQLATKNYNTAAQYRSENGVAWQEAVSRTPKSSPILLICGYSMYPSSDPV